MLLTGIAIFSWVLWIIFYDYYYWNKDFIFILFGERIEEAISLGINMKLIHYLLISLGLLLSGILAKIAVDIGIPVNVILTRGAYLEKEFVIGSKVSIIFKAMDAHVF